MKTIYKYPIQIQDKQTISLPKYSEPIHAGLDPNGVPCIWALVETEQPVMSRINVYVIGTGNPFPFTEEVLGHLGTFVKGPFVWHVFTD